MLLINPIFATRVECFSFRKNNEYLIFLIYFYKEGPLGAKIQNSTVI